MRIWVFLSGVLVIGIGLAAMRLLERDTAFGFLQGTLTLGGGILISGLFSLKMKWHGIIAAGIMALLGAARSAGNLPEIANFFVGERPRGVAPLLELAVMAICLVLLGHVLRALAKERVRRMLEEN